MEVISVLVGTSGGQQDRRFSDRRKSGERIVGASGANSVPVETVKSTPPSVSVENHREGGRRHQKLLVWDQDGNCHEGKMPCLRSTTVFVESTWLSPIGSDVTISLVPSEEDSVGQELAKGMVVWHCPQDDEFGNQAGFGVLFQRQWLQSPGPDAAGGRRVYEDNTRTHHRGQTPRGTNRTCLAKNFSIDSTDSPNVDEGKVGASFEVDLTYGATSTTGQKG